MTPAEKIEQAFLQLAFSIKLLTFFEQNKIDKVQFDNDTTIILKRKNIHLNDNTFNTYDDLVFAAENNFNITLGATAIIMDESLTSAGFPNNYTDRTEIGQLRTLIYMIRCAFAHNMIQPKWQVRKAYLHELKFKFLGETIVIDLNALNGKPFTMEQIGGHDIYMEIKDKVIALIS